MRAAAAAGGDRAVAAKEQDAPVAIPDHWLDQRARQVERAVKNHTPDQLPIRIGRFSERLVRPDSSIVFPDGDPAGLGQRPPGPPPHPPPSSHLAHNLTPPPPPVPRP